jgi:hypothetical protein
MAPSPNYIDNGWPDFEHHSSLRVRVQCPKSFHCSAKVGRNSNNLAIEQGNTFPVSKVLAIQSSRVADLVRDSLIHFIFIHRNASKGRQPL